ncbi:MAG: porin family protein [Myxococcota bacterium]
MKKLAVALTLVVGLLACSTSFAQDAKFGIIAGPSTNTVLADNSDYKDAVDPVTLYSVGIQLDYEFHDFISVTPEILFSRRGWHDEFGGSIASAETDYRISYLEVPLLLRVGVPIGDVIAPKLLVGPHGALFIDGQTDGSAQVFGIGGDDTNDISSDDVNDLQFGITAGAGVDIKFDDLIVTTDIRYMRNFTGIWETDERDDDNIYHASWSLMLGVLY